MVVKQETKSMTGNDAASYAAMFARPEVIAAYPITPQTTIVENLSQYVEQGLLDAEFIIVESEHSALAACMGAAWSGVRTFTATSSQGLLYMAENVFWSGYGRLPIVMPCVNRCLAPGWNIWPDFQDSMAFRDAGWIQMYTKNNQEVFDTVLQSFKISESKEIALPSMPCWDGFVISHTLSQVQLPSAEEAYEFVGPYDDPVIEIDVDKPWGFGAMTVPEQYAQNRRDLMAAMERAKKKIVNVHKEFSEVFGRSYGNGLVEPYGDDEADLTIMSLGTIGDETHEAIDRLVAEGLSVNALRVRTFRPFPEEDIVKFAKKNHKLLVIDRSASFGHAGQLGIEVEAVLKRNNVDTPVKTLLRGIGGEDVPYTKIMKDAKEALKE
jgi:pyruvate/2-oxoacid:ferredoxin oxidoreductase alpha subunit